MRRLVAGISQAQRTGNATWRHTNGNASKALQGNDLLVNRCLLALELGHLHEELVVKHGNLLTEQQALCWGLLLKADILSLLQLLLYFEPWY